MPPTQYDAIVIGAGQAGGPLATALAQARWKTALKFRAANRSLTSTVRLHDESRGVVADRRECAKISEAKGPRRS